jgi:hypothetical protein
MPGFYNQNEYQWGFAYDSTVLPTPWRQLAGAPATVPDAGWISALTTDQNNPDKVYAVWHNDTYLRISLDAGTTWSRSVIFPSSGTSFPFPGPLVYCLQARSGQVFLFNNIDSDADCGIWRSTDDGATWNQLTTESGPGYMSLASSKLWWAERDAIGDIDFKRMNLDGTSRETLGHVTFYGGRYITRAFDDDLCLFTSYGEPSIYCITPSSIVNICPSGFVPWDTLPLSASVFLAAGTATTSSTDVLVQRSVNTGTSWNLVTTITSAEGFALNGTTDSYFMLDASTPARTDVVMAGNAASDVQQLFWISADAGLTWTSLVNAADPVDGSGGWLVYGPGGVIARPAPLPRVAIPARLATIVG